MPLEQNVVRYIDNFSTGTRGAASAEHLLNTGYAVIYLHRRGCAEPFARHMPWTPADILGLLRLGDGDALHLTPEFGSPDLVEACRNGIHEGVGPMQGSLS